MHDDSDSSVETMPDHPPEKMVTDSKCAVCTEGLLTSSAPRGESKVVEARSSSRVCFSCRNIVHQQCCGLHANGTLECYSCHTHGPSNQPFEGLQPSDTFTNCTVCAKTLEGASIVSCKVCKCCVHAPGCTVTNIEICIRCDSEKVSQAQVTADGMWEKAIEHTADVAISTIFEATRASAEIHANIRNNVSKVLKYIDEAESPYLKEKSLCVLMIEGRMPLYVRHAAARAESILGVFAAMYASASTGSHFNNDLQSLMDGQRIDDSDVEEIGDFGDDGIGHTPQGKSRRKSRASCSLHNFLRWKVHNWNNKNDGQPRRENSNNRAQADPAQES